MLQTINCREMSAVSHGITWVRPVSAKQVEMDGATAFMVSGNLMLDPPILDY